MVLISIALAFGSPLAAQDGARPSASAAPHAKPEVMATRIDGLSVEDAWSRATPGGSAVAAGYLRIVNSGREPDRLIAAETERAGRIEIHASQMRNGVASMRPVANGLEIGPGETVELRPGGLHLMLVDLVGRLNPGETFSVTLRFERAGAVTVPFEVRGNEAGAPAAGQHH